MKKKSRTFGLAPEKLAELLRIGSDSGDRADAANLEQEKAEVLHERLADVLPLEQAVLEALPAMLKHLYRELLPLAGESLGNMLQDSHTDISVVRKIKDYGKKTTAAASSEAQHDSGVAIYYAAIASALVFHDQKITQYSWQELEHSLCQLSKKPWITPELCGLLARAAEICKKKQQ